MTARLTDRIQREMIFMIICFIMFQNLGAGPILTILWHFLPINFIVSISKDPNLFPSMTSDPLAPKWPLLTILIWRKRSEKGRFWPFFYVPILSLFA